MRELLSYYSNDHNDLNEEVIRGIRSKDNMVEKIEEICIELAKNLSEYVTYIGVDFDDSKNRFRESNQSKKKDSKTGKFENVQYINVNYTYSRMAVFHFRVNYKDPRTGERTITKVDMPIYIPILSEDGYHYFIRGNKYVAPYQMVDSICYLGRDDSVILKTLTRAIKLSRSATILEDMHGLKYKSHLFYLHVSNKKIPFLLYYFAYFGFQSTLVFFGCERYVHIYEDCPVEPDTDVIYFKFGRVYLGVDRAAFDKMYLLRQFVATTLALGKKSLEVDQISNTFYWRMILGSYISQTRAYDQGAALLTTFITCLDARTMYNIEKIVGGSEKKNSWTVLRWMFVEYAVLSSKNSSLQNKRLRYTEYLVTPLVRDIQNKLYRFLKTRPKMRDLKRLLDVFKPSPNIICNSIIGKCKNKNQMLNITKFSNTVNDFVLLNAALKFSKQGPGSASERIGKRASAFFRAMDSSYIGQVDLITSSSQNVGLAGNLTPFCEVDKDTYTFKLKK